MHIVNAQFFAKIIMSPGHLHRSWTGCAKNYSAIIKGSNLLHNTVWDIVKNMANEQDDDESAHFVGAYYSIIGRQSLFWEQHLVRSTRWDQTANTTTRAPQAVADPVAHGGTALSKIGQNLAKLVPFLPNLTSMPHPNDHPGSNPDQARPDSN